MTSELEERISMYEYNVKKNSEDRREFKQTIASIQENNIKIVETLKAEIDSLRHELL